MPIIPGDTATKRERPSYSLSANSEYTDQYKEDLFAVWYQHNRPRGRAFTLLIPEDENGRIPNLAVVQRWMREDEWTQRANVLDAEVKRRVDEVMVEQKVIMHVRHAEIGKEIMEAGLAYIENERIMTATEAARLIELGARMERENTGGAQALQEVAKMTNKKLTDTIERLLPRLDEGEIEGVIEGEVVEVDIV